MPKVELMDTKRCTSCEEDKPLSEFWRNRRNSDGLQCWCKTCLAAKNTAARQRVPAETMRRRRRYAFVRERYGLSREQYDALVTASGGVCAICREAEPTDVDHDHATGEVRALLCSNCNRAIGLLGDRADRCRAAADYLAKWSGTSRTDVPWVSCDS